MRIFKSIKTRLFFWFGLALFCFILIFSSALYLSFSNHLIKNLDVVLEKMIKLKIGGLTEKAEKNGINTINCDDLANIKEPENGNPILFPVYAQLLRLPDSGSGQNIKIIVRSENLKLVFLPIPGNLSGMRNEIRFGNVYDSRLKDSPLRMASLFFEVNSVSPCILQLAASLKPVKDTVNHLLILLVVLDPLLFLVLSLGGYFLLKKSLSPVASIVASAHKITADDLSHRIDSISTGDEISELIDTFNEMISSLEVSFKQIKQFSSDVSHELKTPLTVIRNEIEVALRKKRKPQEYVSSLENILIEVREFQGIIDNLLFLAKTASKREPVLFKTVSIDKVVTEVFEYVQVLAEDKKVGFVLKDVQEAEVAGDETLLKRVFFNLFENAIKYSGMGSKIEVFLEKKAGFANISIVDEGKGIKKEDLPYIFDTFVRLEKSRSRKTGSIGLGLSIVKRIVEMHNGRIEVESAVGEGSTFTVLLPFKN